MDRLRSILGLASGALMIVSGAAHSLLGWRQLKVELEPSHLPADLVFALGAGWNFGGAAMLAFGIIVVALFAQRLRGRAVSVAPGVVVGTTYVAFGAGAMAMSRFDPFFLVFVIPGATLLFACRTRRTA